MTDGLRERIERRLAGTHPPSDPFDCLVPGLESDFPASAFRARLKQPTPAAVLIALSGEGDDLEVLFTRRTDHLRHHAGQISLPGGRLEPGDKSPQAGALRESEEEVGLPPPQVEVAGYLPNHLTVTGFSVTPVVGFIRGHFTPVPDPGEVAEVFQVPLAFLIDPANHRHHIRKVFDIDVPVFEIQYRDWRIWGVTAGLIVSLHKVLI